MSAGKHGSRVWMTLLLLMLVGVGLAFFRRFSDHMLVVDQPERADVILVLDGDDNDVRFWRAVNLLHAGYGRTVLLDERQDSVQFGRTQADAAQEFIARGQLANVSVCPGRMISTVEEVEFAAQCLVSLHPSRVLIVTSDYHTRRALAIFRDRLPQYHWDVAAAADPANYGQEWWRRRAWAKIWLSEAQKFLWWELVDRWRYGRIAR